MNRQLYLALGLNTNPQLVLPLYSLSCLPSPYHRLIPPLVPTRASRQVRAKRLARPGYPGKPKRHEFQLTLPQVVRETLYIAFLSRRNSGQHHPETPSARCWDTRSQGSRYNKTNARKLARAKTPGGSIFLASS